MESLCILLFVLRISFMPVTRLGKARFPFLCFSLAPRSFLQCPEPIFCQAASFRLGSIKGAFSFKPGRSQDSAWYSLGRLMIRVLFYNKQIPIETYSMSRRGSRFSPFDKKDQYNEGLILLIYTSFGDALSSRSQSHL